jgi:hypothetical protein
VIWALPTTLRFPYDTTPNPFGELSGTMPRTPMGSLSGAEATDLPPSVAMPTTPMPLLAASL